MIIVLGLGNPGKKYAHDRHNIGFHVLDAFAQKAGVSFREEKIYHAEVANTDSFVFVKPLTFMNDSGKAARVLVREYGVPLVVVYDDITISLGEVKCSFGKGDGGHNGLTSLIAELGTKDFFRIRVGIRPVHDELLPRIAPPSGFETFMLSPFAPMEKELKEEGIKKAVKIIEALSNNTFEEIMNLYN